MEELSLKELQNFSLEILIEVDKFCKENKIMYSLGYGTLIGAIRHNGFIPWDDDIDIIMPRKDYETFISTFSSDRFKLMSQYDKKSYITFSRVYDNVVTSSRGYLPYTSQESGVWIDVFPLDGAEDNFEAFKSRVNKMQAKWNKQLMLRGVKAKLSIFGSTNYKIKALVKKILFFSTIRLTRINKKLTKQSKSLKFGETKHFSQLACLDDGIKMYQLCEDFEYTIKHEFEGYEFEILNGYDRFLRNIYGDYMQYPPLEQRKPKQVIDQFYWVTND